MRMRRFMMTSFLCGGIAAVPGYAIAQMANSSGAMLQPNSPWSVSEIAASSPGGKPYCALARRFSNNMVLTMARNAKDETSLAIDFQKNIFSGGQTYHVALSPGFGQDRAFDVVPVSGNAAVVRLGQDYAFNDALSRSARLQIEMAGDVYNFNISDLPSGNTQLNTCLARIAQPAAGNEDLAPGAQMPVNNSQSGVLTTATAQNLNAMAPAAGMASPPPVNAVPLSPPMRLASADGMPAAPGVLSGNRVGDVTQGSDTQLQSLREDNIRLREALEKQRREYEDRLMKESQSGSVANELSEKVQLLQSENNQLHDQLAKVSGASAATAGISDKTASDLAKAQAENDELHRQIDKMAAAGGDAAQAKAELARLQAENDRLNSQIASLSKAAATTDSAKAQIDQLTEQNTRLAAQLAEANAKGGATDAAKEQLVKMQQENDKLRADLQAQMSANGSTASSLRAELDGLRAENARLKQATAEKAVDSDTLASMRKDLASLQVENTTLKQKMASLSSAPAATNPADVGKINALQAENDRMRKTLETQQQQFAMLEKQLNDAKAPTAVSGDQSPEVVLQQRVMQLQAENVGLKEQVAQAQSKMPGGGDGQVTLSQLRSIEAQLEAVEKDRDRLVAQVQGMHQGKGDELLNISSKNWDLEQATRRYNEAQREIDRLGRQIEEQKQACSKDKKALEYMLFDPSISTQEQIKKVSQLENKVRGNDEALNKLKVQYESKVAALQKEVSMKTALAVDAQTKVASLENAAKVAAIEPAAGNAGPSEVEFKTMQMERDELTKKVANLKSQLDNTVALSAAQPPEMKEIQAQRDDLAKQVAQLKSDLEKAQIASIDTTKNSATSSAQLASVQMERDALASKVNSLKTDLENAKMAANNVTPTEEMTALQKDRDALSAQVVMLKTQLEVAQATKNSVANVEMASVSSDKDKLQNQVAALQAEVARLNSLAHDNPTRAEFTALEQQRDEMEKRLAGYEKSYVTAMQPAAGDKPDASSVANMAPEAGDETPAMDVAAAGVPSAPEPEAAPMKLAAVEKAPAVEVEKLDNVMGTNDSAASAPMPLMAASTSAPALKSPDANGMISASQVGTMLNHANIALAGPVKQMKDGSNGVVSYSWQTNGLYGSLEQQAMRDGGSFGNMAQAYLDKTKKRCQGDFAAVPVTDDNSGGVHVAAYEIACVGDATSAGASIVFYDQGGKFTTVAHEASVENMDTAMDVRDKLVNELTHTQIASN